MYPHSSATATLTHALAVRSPRVRAAGDELDEQTADKNKKEDPLRVRDESLLWTKGLSVAETATIQDGRDLEANRVEVRVTINRSAP